MMFMLIGIVAIVAVFVELDLIALFVVSSVLGMLKDRIEKF